MSGWSVEFHAACEAWAERLDQADAEALLAAIRVLREQARRWDGRSSTR